MNWAVIKPVQKKRW